MSGTKQNVDTTVFSDLVDVAGRVAVDVGSGSAGFVAWLNANGASAFGVECSDHMLNQSRRSFEEPNQIGGVGQQLPFATNSVSVVTFMNSLHHVPADQMDAALKEAERVVDASGFIYVLEPVADGPGYETGKLIDDEAEVRALAQAAMDKMVGRGVVPVKDGRYINRYTYSDIDDYFDVMIGVDGSRAATVERYKDQVSDAFHRLGTPTPAGVAFDHPMHYRLFATADNIVS
jgi:ubiquinone/menaquinone biosynthesis C-methylase UbiE